MSWLFVAGIVIFALGILFSVCLHEAGHMLTAKAFGMKVTRYFVGFGPTLWSFKRGETEYGVKGIPAGGFCKIEGMTPYEEPLPPQEQHRAFYTKPIWQRTIVLVAGSVTHFVLGFVLLWATAVFVGLPNQAGAPGARAEIGTVEPCVQTFDAKKAEFNDCRRSDPASPAKKAGLRSGDVVTKLNGVPVANWSRLSDKLDAVPVGRRVSLTVEHGGNTRIVHLVPAQALWPKSDAKVDQGTGEVHKKDLAKTPALGVGRAQYVTVGPIVGFASAGYYGKAVVEGVGHAIKVFPQKIPKLISALSGEKRDPDTPVSVVGASVLGGEAAKAKLWSFFFFLLASLNVFIGIFNLLPLLPLDGGHVAIAWFEKVRSWLAAKRGRPDPGHVDYNKLMPVTYAVILIFGSISILTIMTDIVNPLSIG